MQDRTSKMRPFRKLLMTGVAVLFLATGTAQQSAQAGYYGEDKWITNCRYTIIEKRRPEGGDQPDWLMYIEPADLPVLEREIKNLKKCMLFSKCLSDRDAGKVKHCYENDKRWR
jgi:hypothetical protein